LLNLPIYSNKEFKRLYHGRGEKTYKFLTIDSIDKVLEFDIFPKAKSTAITIPTSIDKIDICRVVNAPPKSCGNALNTTFQ